MVKFSFDGAIGRPTRSSGPDIQHCFGVGQRSTGCGTVYNNNNNKVLFEGSTPVAKMTRKESRNTALVWCCGVCIWLIQRKDSSVGLTGYGLHTWHDPAALGYGERVLFGVLYRVR